MSHSSSSDERIVDALIALARASASHRVIIGGHDCSDLFIELHRRGYTRVATTSCCRIPCGQHDAALVTWRGHAMKDFDLLLARMANYLAPAGVLVIWIVSRQTVAERQLRQALDRLGFRIEAGTCCESGVAVAARRRAAMPAACAA